MMLCLQIFTRCKHNLTKTYGFRDGSWQLETQCSCHWPRHFAAPLAPACCEVPSAVALSGMLKQSLPKPCLNDVKSIPSHLEVSFCTVAPRARLLWKHLSWNVIKTLSGPQQGCCHQWGVPWDWVSALQMKCRESLLLLGLQINFIPHFIQHMNWELHACLSTYSWI